jgi:hypothetical protein
MLEALAEFDSAGAVMDAAALELTAVRVPMTGIGPAGLTAEPGWVHLRPPA